MILAGAPDVGFICELRAILAISFPVYCTGQLSNPLQEIILGLSTLVVKGGWKPRTNPDSVSISDIP